MYLTLKQTSKESQMDCGKCSPLIRKAAYNDYCRCISLHCSHPLRWNEFLCLIPTFSLTFYITEQFHLHCRVLFPHYISRNIVQNKNLVIFHWLSYQHEIFLKFSKHFTEVPTITTPFYKRGKMKVNTKVNMTLSLSMICYSSKG